MDFLYISDGAVGNGGSDWNRQVFCYLYIGWFFFLFFCVGVGCGYGYGFFIPLVLLFEPKDLCIKGGWDSIILCRSGGTICLPHCRPVFRLSLRFTVGLFSPPILSSRLLWGLLILEEGLVMYLPCDTSCLFGANQINWFIRFLVWFLFYFFYFYFFYFKIFLFTRNFRNLTNV